MATELGRERVAEQRGWEALRAIGWTIQSPRPQPVRAATPEEQATFKRYYPPRLQADFSSLPFQSAPTYPASEPCSPPRWSFARPGPHKTPSASAPFFEPGFRVAVQLSGHLDPPLADTVGHAAPPHSRSFSTRPQPRHSDRSRRRYAAPPRRSAHRPGGGKFFGSMRHWQPAEAMSRIAFITSRKSAVRGRPCCRGGGRNGAISAHSPSVRSLA